MNGGQPRDSSLGSLTSSGCIGDGIYQPHRSGDDQASRAYRESKTTGVSYESGIDWEDMTMNIIKRLKRAAWFCFETFVDVIMERGFGVYSYPPPSPEPVRADPHRVVAREVYT